MSAPPFDRALLGGLDPGRFLARHWQRKPCLIRGAIDAPAIARAMTFAGRDRLAALAARDDVESRLVTAFGGRWTLTSGPIEKLPRRRSDWTLLVQGVNLYDEAADALMRRFDFVSAMRLDDLMVSHAASGGGVGAHVDSYDVFLLQLDGIRRWRWNTRRQGGAAPHVDGAPLKLLRDFRPDAEADLAPGDMLYLPADHPHEGVAIGPCTTASIGFRSPSWSELTREFLFEMAERDGPPGRHADRGRKPTAHPGAIDADWLSAARARLRAIRFTDRDVARFIGRHFSEPKPHVFFEPPDEPLAIADFVARVATDGVRLDPKATLLTHASDGYIAGEVFALPHGASRSIRRLADHRRLEPAAARQLGTNGAAAELLHDWWSAGYIHFDHGGPDARP